MLAKLHFSVETGHTVGVTPSPSAAQNALHLVRLCFSESGRCAINARPEDSVIWRNRSRLQGPIGSRTQAVGARRIGRKRNSRLTIAPAARPVWKPGAVS